MAMKGRIEVGVISAQSHNCQILAGFDELARGGEYDIVIRDLSAENAEFAKYAFVTAKWGGVTAVYDTMDGYQEPQAMRRFLENCDFYFKRSFDRAENARLFGELADKMHPLGLNYYLTYRGNPLGEGGLKKLAKLLSGRKPYGYFTKDKFEHEPRRVEGAPKIVFVSRLRGDMGSAKMDDARREINDMRVSLMRRLRDKYGENFIGGLFDSPLTREYAPDLVLDRAATKREKYLKMLGDCDICIASTGLHKSTGWKVGEYVAAARAIVTEPICYEVPGNFEEGRNYLTYTNADECMAAIDRLVNSPEEIYRMECANRDYYLHYVEPSVLVKNTLKVISDN